MGGGGGAKSIVMQISFVMLIFLLGGAKVSEGGKLLLWGHSPPSSPCGRNPNTCSSTKVERSIF